jgi:hypothetical protein
MKAELRHLLDKLKAERPGFKQLIFSHNGRASAIYAFAPLNFDSLDELESWLYRPAASAAQEHDQCQCKNCVQLRSQRQQQVADSSPPLPLLTSVEPRTSSLLQTPNPS